MSALQRMEKRKFWRAWAELAGRDLGARLAETIGEDEPADPDIREALRLMIQAEALLAGD